MADRAELTQGGRRLGTTGGTLVAGTLLTLLWLDRTSYVIDFAKLPAEFPRICERLGVEARLPRANESKEVLRREDLSPTQIANIEERYAADYALLKNRPMNL